MSRVLTSSFLLVTLAALAGAGKLKRTSYTVTMRTKNLVLFHQTNCISITQHGPECKLVRWIDPAGRTNEFHASFAPITIVTNK